MIPTTPERQGLICAEPADKVSSRRPKELFTGGYGNVCARGTDMEECITNLSGKSPQLASLIIHSLEGT